MIKDRSCYFLETKEVSSVGGYCLVDKESWTSKPRCKIIETVRSARTISGRQYDEFTYRLYYREDNTVDFSEQAEGAYSDIDQAFFVEFRKC